MSSCCSTKASALVTASTPPSSIMLTLGLTKRTPKSCSILAALQPLGPITLDPESHEHVLGKHFAFGHELELCDGGPGVLLEARHQGIGFGLVPLKGLDPNAVPLGDVRDPESALAQGFTDPAGLDADGERPAHLLSASPLFGVLLVKAVPLGNMELNAGHGLVCCAQRPVDHQQAFWVFAGLGEELDPEFLLDFGGVASALSYGDAEVLGKDVHLEEHALIKQLLLDELLQLLVGTSHTNGLARDSNWCFLVIGKADAHTVLLMGVLEVGAALADGLAFDLLLEHLAVFCLADECPRHLKLNAGSLLGLHQGLQVHWDLDRHPQGLLHVDVVLHVLEVAAAASSLTLRGRGDTRMPGGRPTVALSEGCTKGDGFTARRFAESSWITDSNLFTRKRDIILSGLLPGEFLLVLILSDLSLWDGLNRLAAIALLFLNEEDAFWCLIYIVDFLMPPDYYNRNLLGSLVDQRVLKDLVAEKLPRLNAHMEQHGLDISLFTFNWFLCVYIDTIPPITYLTIWDSFLYEGSKVLFRYALAIFKLCEDGVSHGKM
ncbi:TBC1 domain family member 2B [Penaeus vannamei]|uniref:TBC1 domain family member 2B n=1 Tax=Penaeus vannamei TaxID=6689 RepID=A0A3R7MCY3_PENVA|nr:TBC1 domain family member 2B [Penaeus vannamei]